MNYVRISDEVQQALNANKPVVALESTIIAHGFTYPKNLECARACEQAVREQGAVPATVAIIKGKLTVGLSDEEIQFLASTEGIPKASRRDVAIIAARGLDGATTVSATMMAAELAGIHVFATGGIGGVHRGASESFDISADMTELAHTPIAVVCAGAKSILDLGLTREYLETMGVPVLGYRTDEFPAFYTRSSGLPVDWRMDDCSEIARVIKARQELCKRGGIVIANPIPAEYEMNPAELDKVINSALDEANLNSIKGKELTPFLLGRIHAITEGASEEANLQLVLNNCRVAAQIAAAYVSV